MALRGRWRSRQALSAILKGINGRPGGYFHDLCQRVYTGLPRPEDGDGIPTPYICTPRVSAVPNFDTTDSGLVKCHWRQPIFCFITEEKRGFDTDPDDMLLKLTEDIQLAVLRDPKLAGTAQNTQWVTGGDELGAIVPGEEYGEAELVLEIWSWYAAADLGPAATA